MGRQVYSYSYDKTEVWDLGASTAPRTAVRSVSGQPGVNITATGNYTKSVTENGITISGIPAGGIGLAATEATVAIDGTWEFPVTGGLTTTPQNTAVYMTSATPPVLTLTSSGNTIFGKVNYPKEEYIRTAGTLPVKVGVFI